MGSKGLPHLHGYSANFLGSLQWQAYRSHKLQCRHVLKIESIVTTKSSTVLIKVTALDCGLGASGIHGVSVMGMTKLHLNRYIFGAGNLQHNHPKQSILRVVITPSSIYLRRWVVSFYFATFASIKLRIMLIARLATGR